MPGPWNDRPTNTPELAFSDCGLLSPSRRLRGISCIALYPGDCGVPKQIVLNGPTFVRFDLRGTKKFDLPGHLTLDLSFEMLNLFDNINFNPNFNPGSGATIFQVTSAYRDTGVDVNDPGGRLGQVVWRVSW